jgi:hypothetical protein
MGERSTEEDPLIRRKVENLHMTPWFLRSPKNPHLYNVPAKKEGAFLRSRLKRGRKVSPFFRIVPAREDFRTAGLLTADDADHADNGRKISDYPRHQRHPRLTV